MAGFDPEVRGMGHTVIRPHLLVQDPTDADLDRCDALAVPSCAGGGQAQHTRRGAAATPIRIPKRFHFGVELCVVPARGFSSAACGV